MIHISTTKKGQFAVTNMAKNGEVLKPSETFTRKEACWKNIKSELRNCYHGMDKYAVVQDDSGEKPVVYLLGKKRVVSSLKPEKPHVPG